MKEISKNNEIYLAKVLLPCCKKSDTEIKEEN